MSRKLFVHIIQVIGIILVYSHVNSFPAKGRKGAGLVPALKAHLFHLNLIHPKQGVRIMAVQATYYAEDCPDIQTRLSELCALNVHVPTPWDGDNLFEGWPCISPYPCKELTDRCISKEAHI